MDRLGNEAVNYLKQVDKTRPFFLYYATYEVHTPLQAEVELIDKYKKKPVTEALKLFGELIDEMEDLMH